MYDAPVTMYDVQEYKFTGKERDSESGLDDFGARYYSSALGRFTIPDWSASPVPVPYADFTDPQTLNLYGYVRNNPLSHADADGHCCDSPWDNSTVIQSYRANSTQFKADLLIGAAKEVVNSVTSTINLLTSSPMPGVYAPGSGTNIPQLEMSNEAQFLGAVAADVAMIAAPFLGEAGTAARGTNILANTEKGVASEARVLKNLGVAKNTKPVVGKEGKSIPDFLTSKTVGEIKDAKRVSNTEQLRIQKEAAQQSGRQHELHTGTKTRVTKPAAQGTNVIRRDDLGPR